MSITPTAMQCLGWAMWRWRAKIIPPPNAITSRPCVWTAATLTPCAGWRIFTASSRQKKPKRISPRSLPASGAALMISNAACKIDRLAQQAEALEIQGNGAGGSTSAATTGAGPGSVWITYRLSQDLWQAGQRSKADTLMRNLAQQKPNDPEQVYAYGLYLSGHPLEQSQWLRQLCRATPAAALSEQPDGGKVLLIVTLQHVKQHTTKKGKPCVFSPVKTKAVRRTAWYFLPCTIL